MRHFHRLRHFVRFSFFVFLKPMIAFSNPSGGKYLRHRLCQISLVYDYLVILCTGLLNRSTGMRLLTRS